MAENKRVVSKFCTVGYMNSMLHIINFIVLTSNFPYCYNILTLSGCVWWTREESLKQSHFVLKCSVFSLYSGLLSIYSFCILVLLTMKLTSGTCSGVRTLDIIIDCVEPESPMRILAGRVVSHVPFPPLIMDIPALRL